MPQLKVNNEYSKLKSVVLGTHSSMGGVPSLEEAYDPKSKEFIKSGEYPTEEQVKNELHQFLEVLETNNIQVFRPNTIENYNQIFARDIGCVIEDKFLITNMINERSREVEAISHLLDQFPEDHIVRAPKSVRFEGGDIMPHNEHIFIGYSEEEDFGTYKVSRTNLEGVNFIKLLFPYKNIRAFELNKSDTIAQDNALHLDCCFQPFGLGHAIIHKEGFKNEEDFNWLIDHFKEENCLVIDKSEMYNMGCNLFSLSPTHIVSDQRFSRINTWLEEQGYQVSKIEYGEISKMEGLLRCSTLPLCRE